MSTIKELLNHQVEINKSIAEGVKTPEVTEVIEQKQDVIPPEIVPVKREKKGRK